MTGRPPAGFAAATVAPALLVAAVSLRILLDILWWVDIPVPGVNLPRAASIGLTTLFLGVAVLRYRHLRDYPLLAPLALLTILMTVGLARSPDPAQGLRLYIRYLSPFLLLLAVSSSVSAGHWQRRLLGAMVVAGALPVLVSLLSLLSGHPEPMELHGYRRLLGAYRNLHSHALAMGFLGTVGAFWFIGLGDRYRRIGAALVTLGALICLYFTYVRTGVVFFSVSLAMLLALERRWRSLAVAVAVGALLLVGSPTLRHRFSDFWYLFTLTEPPTGWETLGSGRLGMWSRSLSAFAEQSIGDQLLGLGLGGHLAFWKGKDPHNEYLLLLYQLGPLGPIAFLWLLTATLRHALRGAHGSDDWRARVCRYVAALSIAVLVCAAISNAFLSRVTLSWLFWAVVGLALAHPTTVPQAQEGNR